jgi:hypothetical protein
MRKGFLASLTAVLAGAGLAAAQTPEPAQATLPAPAAVTPNQAAPNPAAAAAPSDPPADAAKQPEPIAAPQVPSNPPADAAKDKQPERIAAPQVPAQPAGNCAIVEEQIMMLTGRFYAGADYLYWWTKGQRQPPLVTTGPDLTLTGAAVAGVLGVPGTTVLFGNKELDTEVRSGYRFTAGYWLDPDQTVGIEATGFYLSPKGSNFAASSDGSVVLARPFIDTTQLASVTQGETALLIASGGPAGQAGSITVTTRNELWGAEGNLRVNAGGNRFYHADVLAGFRYLEVKDEDNISSTSTAGPNSLIPILGQPPTVVASSQSVSDRIATRNEFYGGQVGAFIELKKGNWFADFTGKIGLGVMHQVLDISGTTTGSNVLLPTGIAATATFPGGLFAQPGITQGRQTRDEFGIVTEAGFNVGYQLGEHMKVYVGYSVLYFRSDVIRPATQIDRMRFDPTRPPANPINLRDQDFWAQGINAGLEFSF